MSIQPIIIQQLSPNDRIKLEFKIEENLKIADYEKLIGILEPLTIRRKVSLLIVLVNFQGWNDDDFEKYAEFAAKYFEKVDKIAIVAEQAWIKGIEIFCKPFIRAKVRYFRPFELDSAREWIEESVIQSTDIPHLSQHMLI
ncbi:STAS/SEC14 domain-containing protein [bacterium]|nr:STAS/SEC14 domain-containing protein [bacterium]